MIAILKVLATFFQIEYFNSEKEIITIEHLLTMGSGLKWEEDVSEYLIADSKNWIKATWNWDATLFD